MSTNKTQDEVTLPKSKVLSIFENTVDHLKNIFNGSSKKKKTLYSDVIVRNFQGKILLLHRGYADGFMSGKWGFPGGHVDDGEDPMIAAVRECLEETGLEVAVSPIEVKEKPDCIIHYYEAVVMTHNGDALDSAIILREDEHRGYEWVEPTDVKKYDLVADLSTYVDELFSKLFPITIAPTVETFSNPEEQIAMIGSLDQAWEILQKAFDESKITESDYLKARSLYLKAKRKEAIELITKAFDNNLISEEMYLEAIAKGGKPAVIGEKRMFGDKMYIKQQKGWRPVGKGREGEVKVESKEKKTATKKPAEEHWWSGFKKYQLNCYPINIDQNKVDVDESGDVHSHWILRWKDPKSGMWKNAYSKEFMQRNAEEKWNRIKNIGSGIIDNIKERSLNKAIAEDTSYSEKDAAAIITIIAHTGLRRGDKAKLAKSGNRGVSTLACENVKVEGDTIKFSFIGKSYQENTAEITNSNLATYISGKLKSKKPEDLLFDTNDSVIDKVFDEVGGEGLKIKDMRTYVATDLARKLLFEDSSAPPPLPEGLSKSKAKTLIKDKLKGVYEKVSQALNNTPAMAKNSYIHPHVLDTWLQNLGLDFEIAKSESASTGQSIPSLDEILARYPVYEIQETDTINEDDEEMCDVFNEPEWLTEEE